MIDVKQHNHKVNTADILTPGALQFVATLHRCFNRTRLELLKARELRQVALMNGHLPTFLPFTQHIRNDPTWRCAPPGPGLQDRRVEITGPVERKMVINALNSGACTFMADFEDANAPTWENCIKGQINIKDAIHRTISYTNPSNAKVYTLNAHPAVLMVRPRGWHLDEAHVWIDGEPCSASLFDFGVYFYHNAHQSIHIGHGPYFYLPKLESHLEARLWNDVFNMAQDMLDIPRGTIRATVLIETILAAFEMDEILFELRDHSAGLNCGRWDYIFSLIKKFRNDSRFVLPDRSAVTMKVPFMDAYVKLLIQTCHKRGVHAMGGMAAQIPVKNNPKKNELAMNQVKLDKEREVVAGHDGTWVAHPALVPVAKAVFDAHMRGPNQLYVQTNVVVKDDELLNAHVFGGQVTDDGVKENVRVTLMYTEHWMRGIGAVDINGLMEDAATAEIARSQVWQWCRHRVVTRQGRLVDATWITQLVHEYCADKPEWKEAATLVLPLLTGNEWSDFLTTVCYVRMTRECFDSKL